MCVTRLENVNSVLFTNIVLIVFSAGIIGAANPHFVGETLIDSRAARAHNTGSRHIASAILTQLST